MVPMLQIPKLLFGPGAIRTLPRELKGLGASRPLLVTDLGLIACGVFGRVLDALGDFNPYEVFSDVPENPTFAGVDQAAELLRISGCDVIVAVGGGSVIDTAKMVAVLAGHPGLAKDYVGYSDRVTASTAPLIALPTTAGTGSEASPDAGVHPTASSVASGITSPHCVPRVAICDPEMTVSLPPRLTAATALDALSHCIEGYLSTTVSPLADALALEGISHVWQYMEAATTNGEDRDARWHVMLGAFAGGVAISKGLGPAHAIAITVGDQGLHHGMLSALGVAATIELMGDKVPEKIARIAAAMRLSPGASLEAAVRLRMSRLGLPGSLREMGYRLGSLRQVAEAAAVSHFNLTSPYRPCPDEYERLIQRILG
jgi:4-hydroxybutyrate dehydrogenase